MHLNIPSSRACSRDKGIKWDQTNHWGQPINEHTTCCYWVIISLHLFNAQTALTGERLLNHHAELSKFKHLCSVYISLVRCEEVKPTVCLVVMYWAGHAWTRLHSVPEVIEWVVQHRAGAQAKWWVCYVQIRHGLLSTLSELGISIQMTISWAVTSGWCCVIITWWSSDMSIRWDIYSNEAVKPLHSLPKVSAHEYYLIQLLSAKNVVTNNL